MPPKLRRLFGDATEAEGLEDEDEITSLSLGKCAIDIKDLDVASYSRDLKKDIDAFRDILRKIEPIDAAHDAKLKRLKELIAEKATSPFNPGNRKLLIFSAFADTASYLYRELSPLLLKNRGVHSGLVTGKDAPSTVDLAATDAVKEVEVLDVVLREECSATRSRALVVEMFSELIPNPCVIRLYGEDGDELGVAACPKLSAGALYGDSPVYRVAWKMAVDFELRESEDQSEVWAGVTSLEAFLIRFTAALAGMQVAPGEALKDFIARHYKLASLRADMDELEKKISKQRQLDVKYQLAKDKQSLLRKLEALR